MTEPAVGGEFRVPSPDPIAADYLLLALRLDQHLPGFVDGYYGPARLKAQVDLEPLRSAAALAADARELAGRVDADVADPLRRSWLAAQLVAIEANARALDEAPAGYTGAAYLEHVRRCFDWTPQPRPAELFEAARARIDQLLPGAGSTIERLAAWDERLVVPPARLPGIVDWLVGDLRERARDLFQLPDGESLRVGLVRHQPWSGYNWYDGNLRSRVDLNTDLPIRAPDLLGVLAHETYPGHHLEHAWKEAQLVRRDERLECSILLINTPECLISEGLADLGRRFAVPADQEEGLLAELFERAGLAGSADPAIVTELARTAVALRSPRARLGEFAVNAALRRHVDGASHATVRAELEQVALLTPDRAEKRLEFIEHPLWRTYVFVYSEGEALLSRWLDALPQAEAARRFGRLLTEQLSPATIVGELGGAAGRG
jgi:hypothetical protein